MIEENETIIDHCDENMDMLSDNGETWDVYCCKPGKRIKQNICILGRLKIPFQLDVTSVAQNYLFVLFEQLESGCF